MEGMMSQGAMPPPMPQQMQGMMSAAPNQPAQEKQGYNGMVRVGPEMIEVKNGAAVVKGHLFMVSDDGSVVATPDKKVIGTIKEGVFYKITPEIADELQAQGKIQ